LNPFHVRYDTLLKRWDQHSKLVELEMAVLAGTQQMEAAERIEMILMQFIQVGMFEDKTAKREWRNMGTTASLWRTCGHSLTDICLDDIKYGLQRWINSLPWLGLFESAQNQRELDSTEWFVDHPDVAAWMPRQEIEEEESPFRVLSVQGNEPKSWRFSQPSYQCMLTPLRETRIWKDDALHNAGRASTKA
jgi:hypothetical protein